MYHVSRVDWQQAIDDISLGKDTPPYEATAESLGLSVDVFNYRLKQYLEPELYGHIPGTFFNEIEDPVAKRAQEAAKKTIMVFQNGALPLLNRSGAYDAAKKPQKKEPKKRRPHIKGRPEEEKLEILREAKRNWARRKAEERLKAKMTAKHGEEAYEKFFVEEDFTWNSSYAPRESNGKRVSGTGDTKL